MNHRARSEVSTVGLWAGGLLVICALLTGGCATQPPLVFTYDDEGNIVPQKRFARHVEFDRRHRHSRVAYQAPAAEDLAALSSEQSILLDDLGRPDLIRVPFCSRLNERVEEWLYLEEQWLTQFVQGLLVYEGPVTDCERVLSVRGYPDVVHEMTVTGGVEWIHWMYRVPLDSKVAEFAFSNGEMIYSQEYQ